MKIIEIEVDKLRPGKYQPRDRSQITDESVAELACDIRARGMLNPLLVALDEEPGYYDLVAGERRWRAAQVIGLATVPCQVVRGDQAELQEMAIVDNLQREDLTPLEEARALQALIDVYGYSQRKLAERLNVSQGWVQQRLALLGAAPAVQELVNTRVFSFTHARALSGLPAAVQEEAATHLDAMQSKDVPLTSRQVENIGRRIKQFLDAARFADVEQQVVEPEMRNAQIALRHLLETSPEEQLGQAVKRLLDAQPDSEVAKLLGRKSFKRLNDVVCLIALMRNPGNWGGYYHRPDAWWTEEIALATERVCPRCAFVAAEKPKQTFDGWCSPCARWDSADGAPVTCPGFLAMTDVQAIPLLPNWEYRNSEDAAIVKGSAGFWYVRSTADYTRVVTQEASRRSRQKVNEKHREKNVHRERLEAFRRVCESREARDADPPLDAGHFQAHWCEQCALGQGGKCALSDKPVGNEWEKRPYFQVLLEIGSYTDNDGQAYKRVDRVVPRCELFRYATTLSLNAVGWLSFSKDRKQRQDTAIRWLTAMLRGCTQRGMSSRGIWSPLRWLRYERPRDKHFDLERLTRCILDSWDEEWGDARIGTLLNTAASEYEALMRSSQYPLFALYNPETGIEETWIALGWEDYVEKRQPWRGSWPEDVEWPFVKEQDDGSD